MGTALYETYVTSCAVHPQPPGWFKEGGGSLATQQWAEVKSVNA